MGFVFVCGMRVVFFFGEFFVSSLFCFRRVEGFFYIVVVIVGEEGRMFG